MLDEESAFLGSRENQHSLVRGSGKAALVTPCLSHLPLHPSCFLGYGAAVLAGRHDLDVIDLNAELHFRNREKLQSILDTMDNAQIVSDALHFDPFYKEVGPHVDGYYAEIPWDKYSVVYVTSPSWFPTVPTEAVLRLSRAVKQVSAETEIFFFGNSLGSWTNEAELKKNGVETVHLNDLFAMGARARPVKYDLLPTPVYDHRDKYLFDLLPFMLKHGCSWGRCKFCSLSKGWNSGYLERSAKAVIEELEILIGRHDPEILVCRDNSLNGDNLIEFCRLFEKLNKSWCGMSRADLSGRGIEALSRSGCRMIFFGLESGSDRTLSAMNKGIALEQMSDFIKRLHSNGVLPAPSLIIGSPWEEMADFEKTIQFVVDHRSYFEVVNIYPFEASPASEMASQESNSGLDTFMRLFQVVHTCEDLGLKVCLGEQCAEYVLFKQLHTHSLEVS